MSSRPRCIHCTRESSAPFPKAHIWPQALLGDHDLVLRNGEVCGDCNHGICSVLEQHLIEELDVMGLIAGPSLSPKGKPRQVHKPGFLGQRSPAEFHVFLNTSEKETRHRGLRVKPAAAEKRYTVTVDESAGDQVTGTARRPFRFSQKLRRALAKIAFETVCFDFGPDVCLAPSFDAVRQFLVDARGHRPLLIKRNVTFDPNGSSPMAQVGAHDMTRQGDFGCFIQLGPVEVFVDLTSDLRLIDLVLHQLPPEVHDLWLLVPPPDA